MSLFSTFSRETTVADWAGSKKKAVKRTSISQGEENDWKDVHTNIERMDELYDAAFYAWLKSEENVLVTSIYLHRVANEYSLDRIINALEWLIKDWRWENSCILIRRVTVDWCDDHGHLKRAELLRRLTCNWNKQYTAALITTILTSSPYATSPTKREEFLRAFTKNWNFSVLSEFFMFLRSRANVDYKLKCIMLQEAARQDDLLLTGDNNNSKKQKQDTSTEKFVSSTQEVSDEEDGKLCCHRRATSNSYKDFKRFMMEEEGSSSGTTTASQSQGNSNNMSFGINRCFQYITPSSSTSSTSSATNSVVSPRYHHHPTTTNNIRLGISSSSSTLNMTAPPPPSSNTSNDLFPSPSSSSTDKKQ